MNPLFRNGFSTFLLGCWLASGSAVAGGATVTLHLGDGEALASQLVEVPKDGEVRISVETTTRRELVVAALREGVKVGNGEALVRVVRPGEPLQANVWGTPGGARLVAFDVTAAPSAAQVFDPPPAGAPLAARALEYRASFLRVQEPVIPLTEGWVTIARAELAAELFKAIDPAFLVYVTAEYKFRDDCVLRVGEPLLVVRAEPFTTSVLRADGLTMRCPIGSDLQDRPEDFLSTRRPAKLVLPQAAVPAWWTQDDGWFEAEVLPTAEKDPRVAKFKAQTEKYDACAKATWAKLDPDGRAGNYDLVTYGRRGEVKSVESYEGRLSAKVAAACGLKGVLKERDAIRSAALAGFKKDEAARLAAVQQRLSSLP